MDHDRLQTLHDMLSADYDHAKYDNTLLNIKLKNQKVNFWNNQIEEFQKFQCIWGLEENLSS